MAERKRVLTGDRPTGRLHLGHYVGSLANRVRMQDDYECFFMIADYHALMSEYSDAASIADNTREVLIDFISCGLDPDKCVLFLQSGVGSLHTELCW